MSASTSSHASARAYALAERLEHFARHRWTPAIINGVVVILLAASLAQWTWKVILKQPATTAAAPAGTIRALHKPADVNSIIASELFGRAESAKPSIEQIPLSSLNVIVSGIMAGGPSSFAVVSIGGAPETPVTIGEELLGGVVLDAVYADRILVRRGGMTESLLLKEATAGLPAGSVVTGMESSDAADSVSTVAPNRYEVSREWLSQQMTTPEFLKDARIVPNAGGGFLVRNIQPGSLYEKFGLKVGDVIRTVNGQPVNSVTDVMKIYGSLGQAGQPASVTLSIVRAGRPEQLTYNLQ